MWFSSFSWPEWKETLLGPRDDFFGCKLFFILVLNIGKIGRKKGKQFSNLWKKGGQISSLPYRLQGGNWHGVALGVKLVQQVVSPYMFFCLFLTLCNIFCLFFVFFSFLQMLPFQTFGQVLSQLTGCQIFWGKFCLLAIGGRLQLLDFFCKEFFH